MSQVAPAVVRALPVFRRPARPALVLLAFVLAGCSGASPEPTDDKPVETGMQIEALVQDLTFVAIAGADVTIEALNLTKQTGADGRVLFSDLDPQIYQVEASASGFTAATLVAQPTGGVVGLDFQLTATPRLDPRNVTIQYKGTLQCAMEALIMSPSCDSVLVYVNDQAEENGQGRPAPEPLEQNASFDFVVEEGWQTLVVDVVFDPESSPGLDGLRITVRGQEDANDAGNYEQYGRFFGQASFTARIEPNGTYEEGVRPVPATATAFQIEVYPHSHGWHAVCGDPVYEQCFLGAGAGVDVTFQVIVTAFYVEPAPEGWTLRGD